MGELIQLMGRQSAAWPKLAKGARRKVLRIVHGQEQSLPEGALAMCYTANAKLRVMLFTAARDLRQRHVAIGKTVAIGEGVSVQVLQGSQPDHLFLVIQDARPLFSVAIGDQA